MQLFRWEIQNRKTQYMRSWVHFHKRGRQRIWISCSIRHYVRCSRSLNSSSVYPVASTHIEINPWYRGGVLSRVHMLCSKRCPPWALITRKYILSTSFVMCSHVSGEFLTFLLRLMTKPHDPCSICSTFIIAHLFSLRHAEKHQSIRSDKMAFIGLTFNFPLWLTDGGAKHILHRLI